MANKSSFVTPLVVEEYGGRLWRLHFQFTYERWCKGSRDRITVPAGFVFDFASIPKFLLPLLPFWAKYNKACVLHDYLYRPDCRYWAGKLSRKMADYVFHGAMLVAFRHHRSGRVVAYLEWLAVRLFGWLAYKKRSE